MTWVRPADLVCKSTWSTGCVNVLKQASLVKICHRPQFLLLLLHHYSSSSSSSSSLNHAVYVLLDICPPRYLPAFISFTTWFYLSVTVLEPMFQWHKALCDNVKPAQQMLPEALLLNMSWWWGQEGGRSREFQSEEGGRQGPARGRKGSAPGSYPLFSNSPILLSFHMAFLGGGTNPYFFSLLNSG